MSRVLELLACSVDLDARVALCPDGERTLTPTEAKLLEHLASAGGRAVDRAELLEEVWGYRRGVISRTVKTTVARLRAKIERDPREPDHVLTVISTGYRFAPADPDAVREAREARPLVAQVDDHPTRATLPTRHAGLVGRADLLDSGRAALERSRLVSLVGPGGIGKTSALVELAHVEVAEDVWDEIVFVDLRGSATAADVLAQVARVLGFTLEAGDVDDALDGLAGSLRARGRLLLVLDDCEGAAAELAHVIPSWLGACPRLAVLLSSREVLRIVGEAVVPVEPLSPADAVALFRSRLPGAPADGYDPEAVRALVDHLDRIPLAIEMAAAWGDLLNAGALMARLGSQLDVLKSSRRDRPTRHGSLRSTVASSWTLLADEDRDGLRQLAVFAGGFTIEDAEAVVEGKALSTLRRLRDRSLLQPVQVAGEPGLRLFRAVRDFAREQGRDPGAELRHGAHLARFGAPERLERLTQRGGADLNRLAEARADLLLAADRARERGDVGVWSRCALALATLARLRGPALVDPTLFTGLAGAEPAIALPARIEEAALRMGRGQVAEGRRALADADALLDRVPPPVAARALSRTASILADREPVVALDAANRAREVAIEAGDDALIAIATAQRAELTHSLGDSATAQSAFEQALPGLQLAEALRAEGRVVAALARIHAERGRPLRARALHEQALAIVREVGDRIGEAIELDAVAQGLALEEDLARAEATWVEALQVARAAGDRPLEARIAASRAAAARRAGRGEAARVRLLEALDLAREVDDPRTQTRLLAEVGELDLSLGHFPAARASLLRALAGAERLAAPDLEGEIRGALGELLCGTGELAAGREQLRRGRALLDAAQRRIALVELLERHAEAEAAAGDQATAEALLTAAADAAELSQVDGTV